MKSRRHACLATAWLVVVACGRIGFDPTVSGDATGDGSPMPVDGAPDSALCDYLPSCTQGEITCCNATGAPFCTIDGPGTCVGGMIARCSIYTQQGCPTGWACCSTPQRPEPSCYDPLFPQPC